MRATATASLLVLFVAGCASAYGERGITGGYDEQWLGETSFRVRFYRNAYTSAEKANALVLRRAAELALENGFRYVRVVEKSARGHVLDVELREEAAEDARDALEIIRETEAFAGGRLSDQARRRLLEIERQKAVDPRDPSL